MITVVQDPSILVNGALSKWFPVHQPISFTLQRRDAEVRQRYKVGNEIHFRLSEMPTTVKAGQSITYIRNSVTVNLVVNSVTGLYIKVAFNPVVNSGVMGFINFTDALIGHYIETKVSYIDASLTKRTIGVVKTKTDSFGNSKVSVQELLKTRCENSNQFLYNSINKKQLNEGSGFILDTREGFNNRILAYIPGNSFYFANGSKQLQEPNGYNMGEFVPKVNFSENKFLSVFNRPTYFVGYPFSLSFIYSDLLANFQIQSKEETKGINGTVIANTTDNLFTADRNNVNRLMIKQSYPSTVKTLDVWLESTGVATTDNRTERESYTSGLTFRVLEFRDTIRELETIRVREATFSNIKEIETTPFTRTTERVSFIREGQLREIVRTRLNVTQTNSES